jgi:hypothetical protein
MNTTTTTTEYKSLEVKRNKRNNILANTSTNINNTQINLGVSNSFSLVVKKNIEELYHLINILRIENQQRKKECKDVRKAKGELSTRVMTLEFELMKLRRDLQPKDDKNDKNETILIMKRLLCYSRDSSVPLRSFFAIVKDLSQLPSSVKTKQDFRKFVLALSNNISIYKKGQLECFKYNDDDVHHDNDTIDEQLILFLLEFSKRNHEISLTMLFHLTCDIGYDFKDRQELKGYLKNFEKIEILKKQGKEIIIQKL